MFKTIAKNKLFQAHGSSHGSRLNDVLSKASNYVAPKPTFTVKLELTKIVDITKASTKSRKSYTKLPIAKAFMIFLPGSKRADMTGRNPKNDITQNPSNM